MGFAVQRSSNESSNICSSYQSS